MAPTHSIAFCNNRGGVGKTFMTFQTACEAARARPDKKVLVIDLSLYGNVTTLLLGGSSRPPEAGGDTIGFKQTMEMVPTTDMRIEGLITTSRTPWTSTIRMTPPQGPRTDLLANYSPGSPSMPHSGPGGAHRPHQVRHQTIRR